MDQSSFLLPFLVSWISGTRSPLLCISFPCPHHWYVFTLLGTYFSLHRSLLLPFGLGILCRCGWSLHSSSIVLPLYISSSALLWVRLPFTNADVLQMFLGYCGRTVVNEEVVCIIHIGRVIVIDLGEIVLQLLHHISVSSLVVSAKHRNSEVFPFCGFVCCLLIWVFRVCYSC